MALVLLQDDIDGVLTTLRNPTYFIGLATTLHDPAVAIVGPTGEVLFAEASERFLQNKRAINCEPDHIFRIGELIETYCDPDAEFVVARTWSSRYSRMPRWTAIANLFGLIRPETITRSGLSGLSTNLLLKHYQLFHLLLCSASGRLMAGANLVTFLRDKYGNTKVSFINFEHHLTHAATACYTSPFSNAVCMVVDGHGEQGTLSYYQYNAPEITLLHRQKGPESLGALYMLFTELCGFSSFKGEEWKVMGLASYGRLDPTIYALISSLIKTDGLNIRYPSLKKLRGTIEALGRWRRNPDSPPSDAADLAHTWQQTFSEIMGRLIENLYDKTHAEDLILTGGCALNSSYAGTLLEDTGFKRLHIPCAPADDGNALGAALLAYKQRASDRRPAPRIGSPYLGTSMSHNTLQRLESLGKPGKLHHLPGTVHEKAAEILAEGKIIGWIQGRAEFGPRALGNRSILADPRPGNMKSRINTSIKFREEFRPFAPAILHEHGNEYFENYQESPYMERTLRFKETVAVKVPAVVHVDGTGRLQTVKREWNEPFYSILEAFYRLTGVPLVLNTSFNIMGKPIIHSVEDAIGLFFTTGMDALVIEDYLIEK